MQMKPDQNQQHESEKEFSSLVNAHAYPESNLAGERVFMLAAERCVCRAVSAVVLFLEEVVKGKTHCVPTKCSGRAVPYIRIWSPRLLASAESVTRR